ncbi:MAG: right-handed parallel beta-helix repeat-containing protein [Bacteroidales bacterium]|jgi:hypothetical protein|nr:right-handed parallel beta-helix repeat-containing protein [Bacteroidales bacterium]
MSKYFYYAIIFILSIATVSAREYHVSIEGSDAASGSESAPFRTIQRASDVAFPGDVITVHQGTYREWVNPRRGGESDERRIVYRAAAGEKVEIKGSERITGWEKTKGTVWKITLPNSFFGDYNPYKDLLYGDWFWNFGWEQHTGEVFLNGKSLWETDSSRKLTTDSNPESNAISKTCSKDYKWYCESTADSTTIYANFHKYNPNKELVEISVRRTCFYPEKPGINYLTISGFHISQAATQWAAPTAEQIGMIATHWNKGWIIEHNVISNSKCSGITLGKERGTGHNVWLDDQSIDGSLHYIEVTFRTLRNGWTRENIGHHIVRDNEIFACEQTGICGSMGAAFSIIENNYIHDIWAKRQFSGAEMAGIKFHAAIDTRISGNRVARCGRGIWLDWMAQGTRVSRNIMYENDSEDIFFEVDHGPYLIDNNILASPISFTAMSQGGAYVHNLFAGHFRVWQEKTRYTPYHLPHSTDVAGFSIILNGDDKYYNNLFLPANPRSDVRYGIPEYKNDAYPSFAEGNAYYDAALPMENEQNTIVQPDFKPSFAIEDNGNEVFISFNLQGFENFKTKIIDTQTLGVAKMPKTKYEQPTGETLILDTDYQGNKRDTNPVPGPFEKAKNGANRFRVW